jgi:cation transport regulator ChaC
MLKDLKHIDHGILLLIKRMVRDLEVEPLAMHEWERAIFIGFEAFRALKKNGGGWLTLDADRRALDYSKTAPA